MCTIINITTEVFRAKTAAETLHVIKSYIFIAFGIRRFLKYIIIIFRKEFLGSLSIINRGKTKIVSKRIITIYIVHLYIYNMASAGVHPENTMGPVFTKREKKNSAQLSPFTRTNIMFVCAVYLRVYLSWLNIYDIKNNVKLSTAEKTDRVYHNIFP